MMHQSPMKRKTAGAARNRGIAMVMVMVAVSLVFVIGISILSGLPSSARASSNMVDRDAAVFLAESGMIEGIYRVQNPPTGESVWSGVTGRTLPGVTGTYDVTITDLGGGEYEVLSVSHTPGLSGQIVDHAVEATVLVGSSVDTQYTMEHVSVIGGVSVLPPNAEFDGDVHVNSAVRNFSEIDGTLSSSGGIIDVGDTDDTDANVASVPMPVVDFDVFGEYTYNGSTYNAEVYTPSQIAAMFIDDDDDDYDDDDEGGSYDKIKLEPSSDNPLGVFIVDGDLTLLDKFEVKEGTLIVKGDVILNGEKLKVEGADTHMALMVDGDIHFDEKKSKLDVKDGVTYLSGGVLAETSATNSKLEVDDGLITGTGLPMNFQGDIKIKHKSLDDDSMTIEIPVISGGGGGGGSGLQVTRYDGAPGTN